MKTFIGKLQKDWKRTYALTVVYGYIYDILFWPLAFWGTTIGSALTGVQFPAPPLVPWEQLAVATANLAVIGYVQFKRDQIEAEAEPGTHITKETEVKTTVKRREDNEPDSARVTVEAPPNKK